MMLRDEGRLPTAASERAGRRATRAAAEADPVPSNDVKSVLIVDDVELVRKIHAGHVGKLGYRTIEAGEGAEAVRLYGENHAGIQGILLDVMMPVMDGYQTATEIRAMEEKQALRRMPIIAVTSLTDEEIKWADKSTAFDCHVDKPTSMSKLANIFESMSMTPDLRVSDTLATGTASATLFDPHGLKRNRALNGASSSDTDGSGPIDGSNEGSENGRKGSNSDSNRDGMRSSGGSGNEDPAVYVSPRSEHRVRSPGPDNRSRRPASGGTTGAASSKEQTSNDGSGQGSADEEGDLKSTMDKAKTPANARPAEGKADEVAGSEPAVTETATKATTRARTTVGSAPANETATTAQLIEEEQAAIPCARCGSDKTRFCYYNNGLASQPRYYCRSCQRYWTDGGALRNLPKGSGRRKDRGPANAAPSAPATDPAVVKQVPVPGVAQAQNEMQRAIMLLMTQVVGFDVNHAANHAGAVASRAGEQVAQSVLHKLGHSSEAIEMAVSVAKLTGWRIGISVSAVATAAVSQGLNPAEIASLIATQLPFLADALVREVSEQVKSMKLTRKSPSGDSNSGGSGGTGENAENAGKSATSAKSNSTTTGVDVTPITISNLQNMQAQAMQRWMNDLQNMGLVAAAAGGAPKPAVAIARASSQSDGASALVKGAEAMRAAITHASAVEARKPSSRSMEATLRTSLPIPPRPSSSTATINTTSTGAFSAPVPARRVATPAPPPVGGFMMGQPPTWLAMMQRMASAMPQPGGSSTSQSQPREDALKSMEAMGLLRKNPPSRNQNNE